MSRATCPSCGQEYVHLFVGKELIASHRCPPRSTDEKSARALEDATKADPRPRTPPLYSRDGFDI